MRAPDSTPTTSHGVARSLILSCPNNLHIYEKPGGERSFRRAIALALHGAGTLCVHALAVNSLIYRTRIIPSDSLIS